MGLPKSVQVCGREYRIRRVRNLSGKWADCNPDKAVIRIHNSLKDEQAQQWLTHELLHAIFHETGQSWILSGFSKVQGIDFEESLVRALSPAIFNAGFRIQGQG